ncbi:hypothetical protein [Aquimarina algiphila]|uniref:PilN domain-containing protein n=1 Tax=Aquimarina algiphila TaxID=2047982 RepID=A0A554VGX1_9FLAO|nr:hypothetical protein [Aquimarina algiphila]TSE06684.1 hypothetical protein FOF46_18425 [Aquimarina algiphila]
MANLLSSYNPIGKTLVSVEYSVQEGKPILFGLELVQKKGELDINQTFTLKQPEELSKFSKTTHLSLVITDDYVLSKEVQQTGTDAEIVAEAFPNLNLNDFYYQILRSTNSSFIAVCRKEYVETCIEQFQKAGNTITTIALGVLKMTALSGYAQGETLKSYTAEVGFSNEELISIVSKREHIEQQYNIEGLTFPATHSLPLAIILDAVFNTDRISGNLETRNQELRKRYKETRFFKNTLQLGVGFLLITLLINFFVFNANYKKWQGLQEELQVYTTQKEQITKKQAEVSTKEALVQSILTTGFSKSSYYTDQIVQAQPATVLLTSFIYQPLTKPIRKNKYIEFRENIISIMGKSTDKTEFTAWLKIMENLPFVEAVTIIQYGLDKKNISDFEITLKIKPDAAKD